MRGLTEALDLEWQGYGIRVMDIMPLFVQTAMVDGMNAKSIKSLGVSLSADDVAAVILQAATYTGLTPRVHWPVGRQTRLFKTATGLAPDWVNRLITRYIATDH